MTNSLFSKSDVDRLGNRLRIELSVDALTRLDAYRLGFASAYAIVMRNVHLMVGAQVSGRPAKSTRALVDLLNAAEGNNDLLN